MAGNTLGTVLKYGMLAGGGYLLYRAVAPGLTGALTPAIAAPAPSGSSTAAVVNKPPPIAYNTLDAVYQRLSAAVGTTPYNVHQFNYFLAQQLPAGKAAPNPGTFLPAGFDDTQTMTLANYWSAVTPVLRSEYGLSGLGIFGGLGALARRGRY